MLITNSGIINYVKAVDDENHKKPLYFMNN